MRCWERFQVKWATASGTIISFGVQDAICATAFGLILLLQLYGKKLRQQSGPLHFHTTWMLRTHSVKHRESTIPHWGPGGECPGATEGVRSYTVGILLNRVLNLNTGLNIPSKPWDLSIMLSNVRRIKTFNKITARSYEREEVDGDSSELRELLRRKEEI